MRYYKASVHIGGDRNHVVVKRNVTPAEIMLLLAIHGSHAVTEIAEEPGTEDRAPQKDLRDHLDKNYGRTRIEVGGEPKPALVSVFPGWPNVDLPSDVKAARVNEALLAKKFAEPTADDGPKPVSKNTYWHNEASGELGMTEKGDVLPEGVTVVTKAAQDALLKEREAEHSADSFTE